MAEVWTMGNLKLSRRKDGSVSIRFVRGMGIVGGLRGLQLFVFKRSGIFSGLNAV